MLKPEDVDKEYYLDSLRDLTYQLNGILYNDVAGDITAHMVLITMYCQAIIDGRLTQAGLALDCLDTYYQVEGIVASQRKNND